MRVRVLSGVALLLAGIVLGYAGRGYLVRAPAPVPDETPPAAGAASAGAPVGEGRLEPRPAPPPARDPLDEARALEDAGRIADALAAVEAFRRRFPRHAEAAFLHSDLEQMRGAQRAAMEPLLDVLDYPPTPDAALRAEQRLSLLIDAYASGLVQRREVDALVSLYTSLLARRPQDDALRLSAAEWQLELGDVAAAQALVAGVGAPDLFPERMERLRNGIAAAAGGIAVARRNGRLVAEVAVGTAGAEATPALLVDTGANMTSLSPEMLDRLGARRAGSAQVRTVAGEISVPVYRLETLTVGDTVLTDIEVLALDVSIDGVDGLLGMDVLARTGLTLPE